MKVWEDTLTLPDGHIINDYSVVDLPSGVIVIATDINDNLILFNEYKYAVNDTVLTFPAGGIDNNETPEQAAARELLEETGYESTEFEILVKEYPYPSKINHVNYMVRAKNAHKVTEEAREATETIGELQLIPISKIPELVASGRINTSYMFAAIALAFPDNFRL